ncbi:PREDICTED: cytochrome b5-like [Ceratosolen solmsi marchali]|uniref:Cytochrome b5 n=1 Tax=Ceratosolen solmsi marchali TaxID=326594 RepID=A0AAJ6YF25_9HYME|nr:PREDICTED: cytochrome b5-like [Ceratosolen solmsi marchali]
MNELKQYTYEEVRNSNGKSSTKIVIQNKVYDLAEFLNEHPGGEEVLLDHAGKDASEDFNDVGHSSDAIALMSKYLVGEIVAEERRNVKVQQTWSFDAERNKNGNESGVGLSVTVIAGAVLLGLLAVLYFLI